MLKVTHRRRKDTQRLEICRDFWNVFVLLRFGFAGVRGTSRETMGQNMKRNIYCSFRNGEKRENYICVGLHLFSWFCFWNFGFVGVCGTSWEIILVFVCLLVFESSRPFWLSGGNHEHYRVWLEPCVFSSDGSRQNTNFVDVLSLYGYDLLFFLFFSVNICDIVDV